VTLANAFLAGINALYDAGGVPATYIDKDGKSKSVTVIVSYDLSTYGDDVEVQQATATIAVRASEADKPRRGEVFTVGGTTYRVISVQFSDELEHTALVG
jgi:hypothetical protein